MPLNAAGPLAATDGRFVGITPRKFLKVLRSPRLAGALLNAQLRMGRRASVPVSTRLSGKILTSGEMVVWCSDAALL